MSHVQGVGVYGGWVILVQVGIRRPSDSQYYHSGCYQWTPDGRSAQKAGPVCDVITCDDGGSTHLGKGTITLSQRPYRTDRESCPLQGVPLPVSDGCLSEVTEPSRSNVST